jgi:hypothetical protein
MDGDISKVEWDKIMNDVVTRLVHLQALSGAVAAMSHAEGEDVRRNVIIPSLMRIAEFCGNLEVVTHATAVRLEDKDDTETVFS